MTKDTATDDDDKNNIDTVHDQEVESSTNYKYTTLLLDMDGVLAEVSQSYRVAIERTCHYYGATYVTQDIITQWKARGNANDDWKLSYDLIKNKQQQQQQSDDYDDNDNDDNPVIVTLEQVTQTFEQYYKGTETIDGLYKLETLIPKRETLIELRNRCIKATGKGIGIVTGRPRVDYETFCTMYNLHELFDASYCMEDGPSKPNPYPIQRCCELLGVVPSKHVVLIGDTPDDIAAAVSAGCSGVGVVTPEVYNNDSCDSTDNTNSNSNEHYKNTPLALVMKNDRGADMILPPGFIDIIQYFPPC